MKNKLGEEMGSKLVRLCEGNGYITEQLVVTDEWGTYWVPQRVIKGSWFDKIKFAWDNRSSKNSSRNLIREIVTNSRKDEYLKNQKIPRKNTDTDKGEG